MIENARPSTNSGVIKMASVKYSELSHAAQAFEGCDPKYKPKYSGYNRGSKCPEEEETKTEQEETPFMLLTDYIKPSNKHKLHQIPQQAVQ